MTNTTQIPGVIPGIYSHLTRQTHLLIAGTTGSGKSNVINGMLQSNVSRREMFVIIDLKRIELNQYRKMPNCLFYADNITKAVNALQLTESIMENRYKRLQRGKTVNLFPIFVYVDEYADLILQGKKQVEPYIIRLSCLARAANIHVITATQRPTRDIISGTVKANLTARLALHTANKQESRNVIEIPGAETLPPYGYGLYVFPGSEPVKVQLPLMK